MNKPQQSPPEDDDDWEERYADPWNMTQKELKSFFWVFLSLHLGVGLAICLIVYYFSVPFFKTEEIRPQKQLSPPFTWPPPETYDSSSLKR
jgi:hypothetical protein